MLALDPASSAAAKLIGHVAEESGYYEIGITALETAIHFSPEEISVLELIAEIHHKAENFTESLRYYTKLKSLHPSNPKYTDKVRDVGTLASMRDGG